MHGLPGPGLRRERGVRGGGIGELRLKASHHVLRGPLHLAFPEPVLVEEVSEQEDPAQVGRGAPRRDRDRGQALECRVKLLHALADDESEGLALHPDVDRLPRVGDQRVPHGRQPCAVEPWEVEVRLVEGFVALHTLGEGRADHAPDELGDVRRARHAAEGHQHLCARAVPPRVEGRLEQHGAHALGCGDLARVHPRHGPPVRRAEGRLVAEAVDDLAVPEIGPLAAEARHHVVQGRVGEPARRPVLHLHHEEGHHERPFRAAVQVQPGPGRLHLPNLGDGRR